MADDMICTLDFAGTDTATLTYKSADSDNRTSESKGEITGYIEINFPSFTLSADDITDLVSSVEVDVTIDSAPLNEKEPISEPDLPEDA